MASRKFSELRAAIAADPIRAERLRHATEAVEQSYESYQTNLKQLRQARNLTQAQMAKVLSISQPEISRIERQTDVYLSTLQSYVAAMGGDLKLLVVFDDLESSQVDLGDVLPTTSPVAPVEVTVSVAPQKPSSEPDVRDINEPTAISAISGDRSPATLKSIVSHVRQVGMPNVACVITTLVAEIRASTGDSVGAARELGAAGAAARENRRPRMAESLWRKSLEFDPTNVRSRSSLGQLLHHQGRFKEAIEYLETVASMDNYATLFLGWSRLMVGLDDGDEGHVSAGINDVINGLHRWSYEANSRQRQRWLRNVKRLDSLGSRFRDDVDHLLAFASSNSNFGKVTRDDLAELESITTSTGSDDMNSDPDLDLEEQDSSGRPSSTRV